MFTRLFMPNAPKERSTLEIKTRIKATLEMKKRIKELEGIIQNMEAERIDMFVTGCLIGMIAIIMMVCVIKLIYDLCLIIGPYFFKLFF